MMPSPSQHQVMFLIQPHLPLLRLGLRLLLLSAGSGVLLLLLFRSTEHIPISTPWNLFAKHRRTTDGRGRRAGTGGVAGGRGGGEGGWEDEVILNQDPNFPRIRDWLFDHIYFSYYDGTRVYTNRGSVNGEVSRKAHQAEIDMFAKVVEGAVQYLGKNQSVRWYTRDHCTSLRYRTVPTVGVEADVTCKNGGQLDRVSLLLPFTRPRVLYHHHLQTERLIVLIMPLQGRIQSLQLFIENLKRILKNGDSELGLCVVYFDDYASSQAKNILTSAEISISNLRTEFILLPGNNSGSKENGFSRGRGLQVGAERTKLTGDVLFFCDVDVLFTVEFLTRCRVTPVKGYQVYMPTVFSLYNPAFVYPMYKHRVPSPLAQLMVKDGHGYWRLWGHGMVCVFKTDFLELRGFNIARVGWGGEDLALLKQVVRGGKLKVIRSLDPGLFHLYHPKNCSAAHSHFACLKVKATNEASRMSLGLWYFRQTEKVPVFGVLAEGNQPHEHHDDPDYDQKNVEDQTEDSASVGTSWLLESLLCLVLVAFVCLDFGLMVHSYQREKKYAREK